MGNYKKTPGEKLFDIVVYFFVILVIAITLYPLVYTFSMAISDPMEAARGHVYLFPVGFDLSAIRTVLSDKDIWRYYFNTLWLTAVGTILGIAVTCLAAYPISRPDFRAKKGITKLILFTMFFSGGLIPTYIVISKYLNLYNSRWAVVVAKLTTAWYILVAKSFFESLPHEIAESARIDGASEYRIFAQLYIPLSKPVLAVLALYYAVSYWNGYFTSMLYLGKKELQPLSLYVRSLVIQGNLNALSSDAVKIDVKTLLSTMQIKYAVIVVSVVPMLLIYPFLSKYLEKGILIGSVKG